MLERYKHGGDDAIERTNREAEEDEAERRDRWATAMLRKIAQRAIGSEEESHG